jgi:hypothetical protein
MKLDVHGAANQQVLASLAKQNEPPIAPPDSVIDSYYERGCHPDIVERVWDQIGSSFSPDSRCLIYGIPSLVDSESGIILAVGYGTAYCVRIPLLSVPEAISLGASTVSTWSNGTTTDLQHEFGAGWVFGAWLRQEPAWCQQACQELCN